MLFSSFALRTPNNPDIIKDDYEITIGFKTDKIYLKRDWERELGERYVDDEVWFEWTPSVFYVKPQYVHILYNGQIVESGSEKLADDLEKKGYDALVKKN